jgi:hypothetical protein
MKRSLIKMGACPQTPGIYRSSASMIHAGRSYRPSLHARICDSAQVPSLDCLILHTDHSSVEAAPVEKHGKRCDPYLPKYKNAWRHLPSGNICS